MYKYVKIVGTITPASVLPGVASRYVPTEL